MKTFSEMRVKVLQKGYKLVEEPCEGTFLFKFKVLTGKSIVGTGYFQLNEDKLLDFSPSLKELIDG